MAAQSPTWLLPPRPRSPAATIQHAFYVGGSVLTGSLAIASGLLASLNSPTRVPSIWAQMPTMTVAEVATYTGDRQALVKIAGFLVTDAPLTLPDDDQTPVIQGSLTIEVEGDRQNERIATTLMDWHETAPTVQLTDGHHRVPIAFDHDYLPQLETPTGFASIQSVDPTRLPRPTQVSYGQFQFPLDAAIWSEVDAVSVDVTRRALPQGTAVVIVAGVEALPDGGGQLISPQGQPLYVHLGTLADFTSRPRINYWVLGWVSLPLAIASFYLQHCALTSTQTATVPGDRV